MLQLGNGRMSKIPSVRPSGTLFKTVSSIEYDVLVAGKLKVKCQSDIYHVIGSETEVMLDEDKPRLASILQPHGQSSGKRCFNVVSVNNIAEGKSVCMIASK